MSLSSTLAEWRAEGHLCDCELVAADTDQTVAVHSIVLAAHSDYFRALIQHDHQTIDRSRPIRVPSTLTYDTLQLLVHALYSPHAVQHNSATVKELLQVASLWQLRPLISQCSKFLAAHLEVQNVVSIWLYAQHLQINQLTERARRFLLRHFADVIFDQEWSSMSEVQLQSLLMDDALQASSEQLVVDAIELWVNSAEREQRMPGLLLCVRLRRASAATLNSVLNHALTRTTPELKLTQTIHGIIAANETDAVCEYHGRPRVPSDLLFVVGGWTNGAPTHVMECYDMGTGQFHLVRGPHEAGQSDHTRIAYHGMVCLSQRLYVVGGFDGSCYYNTVRYYNTQTDTWHKAASMIVQRCYVSVCKMDGLIYAVGGFDGLRRLKSVECYTPEHNQWRLLPNMSAARSDASVVALKGRLMVAGGFTGFLVLASVELYNLDTGSWRVIEQMVQPRSGVSLVVCEHDNNQFVYAIGGFDGSERLNTAERYSETTRTWSRVANMHTPRSNFACAVLNKQICVMGGYDGVSTVASAEAFDLRTQSWQHMDNMNVDRSAARAVVVGGCEAVCSALRLRTQQAQNDTLPSLSSEVMHDTQ